jgi:hypothetical protein
MVFIDRTSLMNPPIWPLLLTFVNLPALHSLSIDKSEAIEAPNTLFKLILLETSLLRNLQLEECVFLPAALHALLT